MPDFDFTQVFHFGLCSFRFRSQMWTMMASVFGGGHQGADLA
jgi:hypothetical protein